MSSPSKEVRRACYQRNREKILLTARKIYLDNKEALLEYQRQYRKSNAEIIRERVRNKRLKRSLEAIRILGGCCSRCEQVFDPVCYDFHHLDPTQKDFTIGENKLMGEEAFYAEVKKCILLCSNCHRLVHKELRSDT